jgi:hypothetical protein
VLIVDYLLLAADHPEIFDGSGAAAVIFPTLELDSVQERESSNYVEGRYFKADLDDVTLKVSWGDSDHDDLPIWLMLSGPNTEAVEFTAKKAVEMLQPRGFRIARLERPGRKDEVRVDL